MIEDLIGKARKGETGEADEIIHQTFNASHCLFNWVAFYFGDDLSRYQRNRVKIRLVKL